MDWVSQARGRLLDLRGSAAGWGYRPGAEPSVEPTVLACLGLAATAPSADRRELHRSADWLATLQQPDGSLGISASLPSPRWPTAYALFLWSALDSHADARARAARWLLAARGTILPKQPDHPVGHDSSIPGWAWVEGTHSWIEPTACAMIALRAQGQGDHPRVREGRRLIEDRAIPSGGWNYGNNIVFGTPLRPQPAPTGMALLALAGPMPPPAAVSQAIAYLEASLPAIRSAQSLGWGLLGLAAWNVLPEPAGRWLAETHQQTTRRGSDEARELGFLLLAAGGGWPAWTGATDA